MTRASRKYVLDTQLFINAFRDPAFNEELQQFHRGFSPCEHVSVIVAQELRAGVRARDRKALERHVLKVYERASRTITLSRRVAPIRGSARGDGAEGRIGDRPRLEGVRERRQLALSCREAGCILVTDNERDFQRIRRFVQFDFTKPWPGRWVS